MSCSRATSTSINARRCNKVFSTSSRGGGGDRCGWATARPRRSSPEAMTAITTSCSSRSPTTRCTFKPSRGADATVDAGVLRQECGQATGYEGQEGARRDQPYTRLEEVPSIYRGGCRHLDRTRRPGTAYKYANRCERAVPVDVDRRPGFEITVSMKTSRHRAAAASCSRCRPAPIGPGMRHTAPAREVRLAPAGACRPRICGVGRG